MNRIKVIQPSARGVRLKKWFLLVFFFAGLWIVFHYKTARLEQTGSFEPRSSPHEVDKESEEHRNSKVPYVFRPISPSPFNIFFAETFCVFKPYVEPGFLHLSKRQACSIYSTAVLNPKHRIIIVHTCPLVKNYFQRWEEDWPELLSLGNVGIVEAEISWLLSGTPVESLLNGKLKNSSFPVEHTSDLVRLAILYKYGGTYMDTDIISIRPLDDLGSNYVGAQDNEKLGSSIINLSPSAVGHQFTQEALSALKLTYEGSQWATNGPVLITNQVKKFCKLDPKEPVDKLGKLDCGLTVYPPSFLYPLPYWEWEEFLNETAWPRVRDLLNNTYIIHFWNKLSKHTTVDVGSQQPYGIIAANYCSPIYHKNGSVF